MRDTRNNPLEDLRMHLPLSRDRYGVRDDVIDEFIAVAHPQEVNGVGFDRVDDGDGYAVNPARTTARRAGMRAARG